jgi:hypothetical protein
MESVPALRSTLRSGSTRWSCALGTATRQWWCGILILFRLREEVLGELVGVDGGVQQGRGGGGRGGEEGGVEVWGGEEDMPRGGKASEGGRGMGGHRRVGQGEESGGGVMGGRRESR